MPGALTKKLPRSVPLDEPMFIRINPEYESSGRLENEVLTADTTARASCAKPRLGRKGIPKTMKDDLRECSTASGSASESTSARSLSCDNLSKDDSVIFGPRTTVTLQGIPKNFTLNRLLQVLDEEGFERCYDLVYLPVDFMTQHSLGHALINLASVGLAARFFTHFTELTALTASWSDVLQGLLPCVEWYRNSPVMHATVPADFKPLLFADGVPVAFPQPTKPIIPPKLRICPPPSLAAGKHIADTPKSPLCAPPPPGL